METLDPIVARQRIKAHHSHIRADQDLELLARDELRAIRLGLEYLKPDLALTDYGIRHAVVVFGSTRLREPKEAAVTLGAAKRALERDPDSDELRVALARAENAVKYSACYEIAREFGERVGTSGAGPRDNRLVVMTGGGPGAMEGANRGASGVGAASIGLNITLPQEQEPNPYLTPGLSFQFRYFALRKLHFMLRARALVAFPGGFGTFDELFETLCLVQTGKRDALPIVLVGQAFWERVINFDALLAEGMIGPDDAASFQFADSAEEIWTTMTDWYTSRGRSIFDEGDVMAP